MLPGNYSQACILYIINVVRSIMLNDYHRFLLLAADDLLNSCESRIPKSSSRLYRLVGARTAHKSSSSDISSSSESSTSSSSTSLGYKSRSSNSSTE